MRKPLLLTLVFWGCAPVPRALTPHGSADLAAPDAPVRLQLLALNDEYRHQRKLWFTGFVANEQLHAQ